MASFFITSLFGEIRYIEIDSIKNTPVIEVKSLDDYEAIISEYGIRLGYLQKNTSSTMLYVIADSVYFSFPLNGYNSLSDFKNGNDKEFKNGNDYYKAISLGLETSDLYYYYKNNSFSTIEDCRDAYENGFVGNGNGSSVYYDAKKSGYSNYNDYKEYLDYTDKGFKNKTDWKDAIIKEFDKGSEYYKATENGFVNYLDFSSAKKLGITTNEDFQKYSQIKNSFEKIMKEKKLDRKNAILYYYIQNLPKGDNAISALAKNLKDNFSSQTDELKTALNLWYSEIDNIEETKSRRDYYSYNSTRILLDISNVLSTNELTEFFSKNDITILGNYNQNTQIFRKK